jgi:hypothetical protein
MRVRSIQRVNAQNGQAYHVKMSVVFLESLQQFLVVFLCFIQGHRSLELEAFGFDVITLFHV